MKIIHAIVGRAVLVGGLVALPLANAWSKAELPGAPASLIDQAFIDDARDWLSNPVVELSVQSQNKLRKDMTQADIDAADQQWLAERTADDQPLVAATLTNPLSSYLTQIQARSGGVLAEVFVMDANGLNVGQSSITSDFWQGDEAKFQKTYPVGIDAIFIDEAEYNEDHDAWLSQLNMTLADANGAAIGAVTIEINLNELARRRGL
ncbi:hypothetical protein [Thalassospira sp.]|uniref:hypothetical protein n=1 Tax=Thalassospira sp. TaxID=1912094 RepID=UPI0027356F68|nr:hypothetical protein [Thalassospira sp.]MDP2700104.1 hypothetical protein [Thalassospira sp.]